MCYFSVPPKFCFRTNFATLIGLFLLILHTTLEFHNRMYSNFGLVIFKLSQLSPVNWLQHMGGSKEAADAVMDRILHNYQLIQLEGLSQRSEKPKLKNEE